jgi:hypothetical protein
MRSLILLGAFALAGCAIETASTDTPVDPTGEVSPDSNRARTPPVLALEMPGATDPAVERSPTTLHPHRFVIRANVTGASRVMLPHPDPSPDPGPR